MLKNDPGYLFVKLNKILIKADQSHGESKLQSTYARKDFAWNKVLMLYIINTLFFQTH